MISKQLIRLVACIDFIFNDNGMSPIFKNNIYTAASSFCYFSYGSFNYLLFTICNIILWQSQSYKEQFEKFIS